MGGYIGNRATVVLDLLTNQKDTITLIAGDITHETLDILKEEIGGILVFVKSTHYNQGAKYGHIAVILGETRMRNILNNTKFLDNTPVDQGAYNPSVIANAEMAANRAHTKSQHDRKNYEYKTYLGIETGTKELIKYAVGSEPPSRNDLSNLDTKHHRQ